MTPPKEQVNICVCGHEKYTHGGPTMQCIYAINGDFICLCNSFRPAPQGTPEKEIKCCPHMFHSIPCPKCGCNADGELLNENPKTNG